MNQIAAQSVTERGALPIRDRVAVTAELASQFTGISRTRIYELLRDGAIEGKVVRGRRLVLVDSLLRLLGEAPSTKREVSG